MAWSTHLVPGAIFAGDFRIHSSLASGGMGAVFVAEQLSTGHYRALKVMHPELFEDERSRQRFANEAQVGGRIDSEHIVECVAAGVDPSTWIPWMAMELLVGETLEAMVRRRGPLPTQEVNEIFEQLEHGLGRAHAQGVIHLDLKPQNLFMAQTRSRARTSIVKILDFGISKMMVDNASKVAVTTTIASPLWMAPEQAEPGAALGPTADVWALGLLAYYFLTGQPYWANADHALALTKEVFLDPIPPASDRAAQRGHAALLPPGFDAWFAGCVVREPTHRYANAEAAIGALRSLLVPVSPYYDPASFSSGSMPVDALSSGSMPVDALSSGSMPVDALSSGPEDLYGGVDLPPEPDLLGSAPVPHSDRVVGKVGASQLAVLAAKQTVLAAPKKSREELMRDHLRMEAKQRRVRILTGLLVVLSVVAFVMLSVGVWVFIERM